MKINTVQDFGEALKQGPYAWPGGYPLFFLTEDGAALSFATAWGERALIARAIVDKDTTGGWLIVGSEVNWEDPNLIDSHTGGRIESAYAEDDAEVKPTKVSKHYLDWYRRIKGLPLEQPKRGMKIDTSIEGAVPPGVLGQGGDRGGLPSHPSQVALIVGGSDYGQLTFHPTRDKNTWRIEWLANQGSKWKLLASESFSGATPYEAAFNASVRFGMPQAVRSHIADLAWRYKVDARSGDIAPHKRGAKIDTSIEGLEATTLISPLKQAGSWVISKYIIVVGKQGLWGAGGFFPVQITDLRNNYVTHSAQHNAFTACEAAVVALVSEFGADSDEAREFVKNYPCAYGVSTPAPQRGMKIDTSIEGLAKRRKS